MKHAKHVISWSMPNTPFYEARQVRKHVKYSEHAST